MLNAPFTMLLGMSIGLALFYWGGAVPLVLAGLVLFGALAFIRPDLGLLFVPLTAPLYLIPAVITGVRSDPTKSFLWPVHEAALLVVAVATAASWLRQYASDQRAMAGVWRRIVTLLRSYAPQLLFLAAGVWGLAIAIERAPALIEFRRLIGEPLLFYALLKFQLDQSAKRQDAANNEFLTWLLTAFVLSGAVVGLFGLLQYLGLDLVPFLGQKVCFCQNIVVDAGARRVASVYGHPNNLGLYLGRVWPIATALGIAELRSKNVGSRTIPARMATRAWFWILGALLSLGGVVVSFSRGGWLAVLAALAVLALPFLRERFGRRLAPALAGFGIVLAALAALALTIRGDVTSGSTPVRLLLWSEALGYIRQHPLGIGLDQFGYYHDPKSGLSLIDPSLIGTSDQFAAHPHNLLLDIWLRLGPLGLAAFGWLLARFFRNRHARADDPVVLGALAAMTAALVHGLVDNFYFVPDLALVFWLLLILVETKGYRNGEPSPVEVGAAARQPDLGR
jgi:O-antigen ligase